jgi:hypothetical protein
MLGGRARLSSAKLLPNTDLFGHKPACWKKFSISFSSAPRRGCWVPVALLNRRMAVAYQELVWWAKLGDGVWQVLGCMHEASLRLGLASCPSMEALGVSVVWLCYRTKLMLKSPRISKPAFFSSSLVQCINRGFWSTWSFRNPA